MHPIRFLGIILLFAVLATPTIAESQEKAVSRRPRLRREWEGFAPGSSAQVQRRRIVYNQDGEVESSTTLQTTTTLVERADGFNSVKMQLKIDVGGTIFRPDPSTVRFGAVSEKPGEKVSTEHLGTESLTIGNEEFECKKYKITVESESGRRVSRVWVSEVYPYVMKSEATVSEKDGNGTVRITANIVAMEMPIEVLSEVKSGVVVRIVSETDESRSVTLEASCPEVPGGLIWHSKKVLVKGQLQEESHLRLTEYRSEREANAPPIVEPRRRLLHRLKNRNRPRTP
jgi:hypothetical protein